MILVVDIGNTKVSCGLFEDQILQYQWQRPTPLERTGPTWEGLLPEASPLPDTIPPPSSWQGAVICSVVPSFTQPCLEMVRNLIGIEAIVVHRSTALPIRLPPGESLTVGADRLVAAAQAFALVQTTVIVLDVGTATTVDAVSAEGSFLGGVILPGPALWLRSLHQGTAALPKVESENGLSLLGKTTAQCIQAGLSSGYPHLLRGLVRQMQMELRELQEPTPTVLLTGGAASQWAHEFPEWRFERELLLQGLASVFYWSQQHGSLHN